jgi:hypothetical protein
LFSGCCARSHELAKNFKLVKSLKDEIELVEGQITDKKAQLETKVGNCDIYYFFEFFPLPISFVF